MEGRREKGAGKEEKEKGREIRGKERGRERKKKNTEEKAPGDRTERKHEINGKKKLVYGGGAGRCGGGARVWKF